MFDLFNEKARRAVFFARYEASTLGSPFIGTEHLLLGLLREDTLIRKQLALSGQEAIRRAIEQHHSSGERISTSVDLPLLPDASQALTLAKDEAVRMGHQYVKPAHITLGLLLLEGCYAARLLQAHGIAYAAYSAIVQKPAKQGAALEFKADRVTPTRRARPAEQAEALFPASDTGALAPSLHPFSNRLEQLLNVTLHFLDVHSEAYGLRPLKRIPLTRAEALGYLVDFATAHQQLFARALAEAAPLTGILPAEDWAAVAHYRDYPWPGLVDTWFCLNRLLLHILVLLPETTAALPCRIGIKPAVPLTEIAKQYVEKVDDLLGQIFATYK